MKIFFVAILLFSSHFAISADYTCDLNGQPCPEGYRCPIRWSDGPYTCVRSTTQKGTSLISFADAEENALNNASKYCRENDYYYAQRVYAPKNTTETYYRSRYGDEGHPHTRFISVALFDCH